MKNIKFALRMEVIRTCETSVDIYSTTRRYIPEDSKLKTVKSPLTTQKEMEL
jgi:hypothetical protein